MRWQPKPRGRRWHVGVHWIILLANALCLCVNVAMGRWGRCAVSAVGMALVLWSAWHNLPWLPLDPGPQSVHNPAPHLPEPPRTPE